MDGIEERKHINGKRFLRSLFRSLSRKRIKGTFRRCESDEDCSQSEKRPYESLHSEHTVDSEKIHLCSGKADKETVFCFSADTDKNH